MIKIPCRGMLLLPGTLMSFTNIYNTLYKQSVNWHESKMYFLRKLLSVYEFSYSRSHSFVPIDVTFGLYYRVKNRKNYYDGPFYDACDTCILIAFINSVYKGIPNTHIVKELGNRLICLLDKDSPDNRCICANCPLRRFINEHLSFGDVDIETFKKALK